VVIGKPGDLIFKPRDQWHTFWNGGRAGADPRDHLACRFERFFSELVALAASAKSILRPSRRVFALWAGDGPGSVPELVERFGLVFPGEPV